MILWINGPFGVGKTQTAFELHRRLPGSTVFDPESFGYFLRRNTPKKMHYPDFQDDPLWRETNAKILHSLAKAHDGVVIVPMTVICFTYFEELLAPVLQEGLPVKKYTLLAQRPVILRRIKSRGPRKDSWAIGKLDACLSALSDEAFGKPVFTDGLTISQAAEEIARHEGLSLLPRAGKLRQALNIIRTSLQHIR
jgi:hypothetical protein